LEWQVIQSSIGKDTIPIQNMYSQISDKDNVVAMYPQGGDVAMKIAA
jgi:hypothetical protein